MRSFIRYTCLVTVASLATFTSALPIPQVEGSTLINRGLFQGIGLFGANGQNNEDSSENANVLSGGDQLLSGQNISNSPKLTTGGTENDFSVAARDSATDGVLISRGIIQGLGLLGGNGSNNEDSSESNNVVAHGNQQLSGQSISNNPVATIGGLTNDGSVEARSSEAD